jgi:hypothetical protein
MKYVTFALIALFVALSFLIAYIFKAVPMGIIFFIVETGLILLWRKDSKPVPAAKRVQKS